MGSGSKDSFPRIYADHAATTPVRAEVFAEMEPFWEDAFGNASSLHLEGRRAREAFDGARERVKAALGALDFEVIFTSGGTEADQLAVVGGALARLETARGKPKVLASAVEHPAVLASRELLERLGVALELLPVDSDGRVDLGALEEKLRAGGGLLVSIMAANNETGVLQPVREAAELARRYGVPFHCDAVQALGKTPLDPEAAGIDLLVVSAHKVYGPKGIAALLVRRGCGLLPLLPGGEQQGGLRGGTEPVALAAGCARAVELAVSELAAEAERLARMRDAVRSGVLARFPGARVNTPPQGALPSHLHLSFPRIEGESIVARLDRLGVAASTGSACSTGRRKPSHVLEAMGRAEKEIRGSVRFSFGRLNTEDQVPVLLDRLENAVRALEELTPIPPETA